MQPVDELFPNSEGVYRQDVEANLQDEQISGVRMDKNYQVYSTYEQEQMQKNSASSTKQSKKDERKAKYTPDLSPNDQDFIPNFKAVRDMFVDGQGIEK